MTTDTFKKWVLYDGECGFCKAGVERFGPWLRAQGYGLAPLQESWVQALLKLPPEKLLEEMRVITSENQVLGGVDAFLYIAREAWWAWPFYALSIVPGMKAIMQRVYRFIAERRHCLSGACRVSAHVHSGPALPSWTDWLGLVIFPAAAFLYRSQLPAWGFMWALSFGICLGFKWLTLQRGRRAYPGAGFLRSLAYFCGWPGMDAENFLDQRPAPTRPTAMEWILALGKALFGGLLFWGIARRVPAEWPLLQGWVGMFGIIFLLHFGSFHLLGLLWRSLGIPVNLLMNAPVLADSLSDFWSRRWNLAFRELTHNLAFYPLHKSVGTAGALLVSFLISGLIHDLVISVPAGAGYGLPTLYFLLQGGGVAVERSAAGKTMGMGRGAPGWLFTMLITVGPAFWLFHPPFVTRVMLPFMKAMGAL